MVLFTGHLFCFGLGYSALRMARDLKRQGWRISGTVRTAEKRDALAEEGFTLHLFDDATPLPDGALTGVTHVLCSIPPSADGDPVINHHSKSLIDLNPEWIGYWSTTGVYGDTGGDWVDEGTPVRPTQERSKRRAWVEERWLDLWRQADLPVHVFRLAGIYGPGRSTLDQVRSGQARRIVKPSHVFSRIHVDDVGMVTQLSMAAPDGGAIYNVCDDEPAPPADVVAYACDLLDAPLPPEVPFSIAVGAMSPMAASFWADNRRVRNIRLVEDLGVRLHYPTYRQGLEAILKEEQGLVPAGPPPVPTWDCHAD